MGEEKVEKQGLAHRGVDFVKKVLGIFENLPKAMIGIALIISLATGGTAAISSFMSPGSDDIKELRKDVVRLKIWNEALRERTRALIGKDQIEFDGYLLDLDTGNISPVPGRIKSGR